MSKLLLPLGLITAIAASGAFVVAAKAPIQKSAESNDPVARGRYLVSTMMCADCHTPLKMGKNGPEPDASRYLSGHPQDKVMPPAPTLPRGPWIALAGETMTAWAGPWGTSFTANLTPDKETGLGRWTFDQFRDAMRTGRHEGRGRPILPPMPYTFVANLTDQDLSAVFSYLQSIPAIENRVPQPIPPADSH
jgi:cytochrome c